MLIYKPDLPRIKLELGVLYFRLGAFASAKRYLDDIENYDPPKEVKEKVAVFLDQIENETKLFKTQSVVSLGMGMSGNANAGLDTDVVTVVGDLGAIDLQISNKPKSDQYYTAAFSSQITQDLRHPRGDTINYVFLYLDRSIEIFPVLIHLQVYFPLIENLICLMMKNWINKSIFYSFS